MQVRGYGEPLNPGIQYLRAIAALSVTFYHAAFYLSLTRHDASILPFFNNFGFFGVALFFAISGYLMARIAPRSRPWTFLAHRIVRIYPLFLIAAVPVFLFKAWSGHPIAFDPFAFGLIPGGPRTYIVGTEWTLPFEMTFYVIVFLAIVFGAGHCMNLIAAVWLLALVAALIWLPSILTYGNTELFPPLSLLLLSPISTGFVFGLLLPASIDRRLTGWPLLAIAAALIIAGCFNRGYIFPLMGAGGACLVAAATSRTLPFRSVCLAKLGDWSYAVYLVHVPVLLLIFNLLPAFVSGFAVWVIGVAVSIAVAVPLGMLDIEIYRRLKRWCDQSAGIALPILGAVFLVGFLSAGIYWDSLERNARSAILQANALGAEISGAAVLTDSLRARGMKESSDLRGSLDRIADEPEAKQTLFDGWALDMSGKDKSPAVLIFVNEKFAGAALPVIARPDVLTALHPVTGPTTVGFFIDLPTSVCSGRYILEILIVSGERFATLSNTSREPDCGGRL